MNSADAEGIAGLVPNGRLSTGLPALDQHLGGGLIPGTLTVVVGATGIGKTQLGLHFFGQSSGAACLLDLSSRGDSQGHAEYASRLFAGSLSWLTAEQAAQLKKHAPGDCELGEALAVLAALGKRPSRDALDDREWDEWQLYLNRHLHGLTAFLYHHFVQGTRRLVVDGFEPSEQRQDSLQFELFEYLYQQILGKDAEWLARDVYREQFRERRQVVERKTYAREEITTLALCTSHHALLDDLLALPLNDNDFAANANTLLYLGKIRDGMRMRRALYVAKHRGSDCSDAIIPFEIDEQGWQMELQ